ncbi:MAG: hypothetical protein R3C01_13855 [Planctomycetaceae bacterium]
MRIFPDRCRWTSVALCLTLLCLIAGCKGGLFGGKNSNGIPTQYEPTIP